jgi:tetratricopeptide (TPR) repeat protein
MTSLFGFHTIVFHRVILSIACFLTLIATVSRCSAEQNEQGKRETGRLDLQRKIQAQLLILDAKEHSHVSNRELGFDWSVVGLEYFRVAEFSAAENAFNRALKFLGKDAGNTDLYADALNEMGDLYRVYGDLEEALNCQREALALRQKLGDPLQIARSESHLGEVGLLAKKYKEAFSRSDRALRTFESLSGSVEKRDLLSAFAVRAYAECGLHRHAECLSDAQQALTISQSAFPKDSMEAGTALLVLGLAQLENGAASEAEESVRQGLTIFKKELAPTDPRVIHAMSQDRDCLKALHRKEEVREIDAQVSAIGHQPAQPCASCTVSVYGLRVPNH